MLEAIISLALVAAAHNPVDPVKASGNQKLIEELDASAVSAGVRVAEVLNPVDLIIAVDMRGFDEELIPALRKQEDFVSLEARYPGLLDQLAKDLRPFVLEYTRKSVPQAHQRLGRFFAQRFSKAELNEVSSFYSSPTGQKIIRAMLSNASMQSIVENAVENPDTPASIEAVNGIFESSLAGLPHALNASDRGVLREVAKKPWFIRMDEVGADMRRLQQQMLNEPDALFDARLDKIITATVDDFIARTDAAGHR